jgi:hypothetical protein
LRNVKEKAPQLVCCEKQRYTKTLPVGTLSRGHATSECATAWHDQIRGVNLSSAVLFCFRFGGLLRGIVVLDKDENTSKMDLAIGPSRQAPFLVSISPIRPVSERFVALVSCCAF